MNNDGLFFWFILIILLAALSDSADSATPQEIERKILTISSGGSIPSEVFLAMAKAESGLNPNEIGDDGKAHGLFQIHEPAARDAGFEGPMEDLFIPSHNIKTATFYLYWIYNQLDKNLWCSVSAFNKGMGNIKYSDLERDCINHKYVERVKYFLKATNI